MNNVKALLLLLLALSFTAAHAQTAKPSKPKAAASPAKTSNGVVTSWQKVPIPALHQFKPQEPRRVQLPNGMVIFLQEDHELPLIDGTIRIRGGSREEPVGKVGMIALDRKSTRLNSSHEWIS